MSVYYFIKAELDARPWPFEQHLGAYRALLTSTNVTTTDEHDAFIERLSSADPMTIVYARQAVLDELSTVEQAMRSQHEDLHGMVTEAVRVRYVLRQSQTDSSCLSDGAVDMYNELEAARAAGDARRAATLKSELDDRVKPSILTRLRYATHLRND